MVDGGGVLGMADGDVLVGVKDGKTVSDEDMGDCGVGATDG